ncbi:hypothetical protein L6164_035980 [Bauhinia variegata]|uniref:Uncharacterized protein n=1 Tax=Bauhinia variegata TaxID=167791 RepID=A0ACB9KFL4_BAUVA|nr:hypothetical protein L6164_035980 [Bauhinia variegata]
MARIPLMFERLAAAFDADVSRVKLCKSSGSEHSPESLTDLSDLVKSFMEKNDSGEQGEEARAIKNDDKDEMGEEEIENDQCSDYDKKEILQSLFAGDEEDDEEDRNGKEKIKREVEHACGHVGDKSSPEFKRRFMTRLREKGFDAGLCKSRWEKNGRFPAGDYEYIDVNFAGKRYIIEVSLAGEFEIARPSAGYSSLLDVFPLIFVGKKEELKQVVRLMCTAIKASMKSMDLHVPPWRRNRYVQAKWFSSYRRTTNEVSTRKASPLSAQHFSAIRSVGFEARTGISNNCRDDCVSKTGFRVSHLTSALNSEGVGLGMQL